MIEGSGNQLTLSICARDGIQRARSLDYSTFCGCRILTSHATSKRFVLTMTVASIV